MKVVSTAAKPKQAAWLVVWRGLEMEILERMKRAELLIETDLLTVTEFDVCCNLFRSHSTRHFNHPTRCKV